MKYTLFTLTLLVLLQVIYAQIEDIDIDDELDEELVDVERSIHKRKVCLKPKLFCYLGFVKKVHGCPRGKPFGFLFKVVCKNNVDIFVFFVKICRKKFKPQLPKKIFKCGFRRAKKQCKTLGLPKCVTRPKQFLYRTKLVSDCLARVLRKCSNGEVKVH